MRFFHTVIAAFAVCLSAQLAGCSSADISEENLSDNYTLRGINMILSVTSGPIEMSVFQDQIQDNLPKEQNEKNIANAPDQLVTAEVFFFARQNADDHVIPIKIADPSRITFKFAGEPCTDMKIETATSQMFPTNTSRLTDTYLCSIPLSKLEIGSEISASYLHTDGTEAVASVRWPGYVSDIAVEELGPVPFYEDSGDGFLRNTDMTVSWKRSGEKVPDSIGLSIASANSNSVAKTVYYSMELPGSSTGLTVPKSAFENMIESTGREDVILSVTTQNKGVVSPLLQGGDASASRTIYRIIPTYPFNAANFSR